MCFEFSFYFFYFFPRVLPIYTHAYTHTQKLNPFVYGLNWSISLPTPKNPLPARCYAVYALRMFAAKEKGLFFIIIIIFHIMKLNQVNNCTIILLLVDLSGNHIWFASEIFYFPTGFSTLRSNKSQLWIRFSTKLAIKR